MLSLALAVMQMLIASGRYLYSFSGLYSVLHSYKPATVHAFVS